MRRVAPSGWPIRQGWRGGGRPYHRVEMCLSYPALVLSVDRDGAVVRGAERDFRALTTALPEVVPGDYVLVAGGVVLERLDPDKAREIRHLFERATLDHPIDRADAAGGIRP